MKTNLAPNVASSLCYLPFVGWIAAIVFLVIEKDEYVRLNAVQGLLLMIVIWFLALVTTLTVILPPVIWLAGFIIQIILTVKIYNGEKVMLPVLGDWSSLVLEKTSKG